MTTASLPSTSGAAPAPALGAQPGRYAVSQFPVRRFTVAEYHRMIEQGFFARDERCELLEGWIVSQVPKNPPHDAHVAVTRRALDRRLSGGWHVRVQSAITTSHSQPQPDIGVVRGDEMDYNLRHPEAADIALVAEVSSSTLNDDRTVMGRIYAHAGVPTYWIVNLIDRQVEVYEQPSGPVQAPSYGRHKAFVPGEAIPFVVAGKDVGPVPVNELLP